MATTSPIDSDHVLLDPRLVFLEPAQAVACADLDAARNRQILEHWRHDALELQTVGNEPMSGGEARMMQRVSDGVLELERQTGVRAPHKRSITW
jgi:hypothetical protein